MFSGRCDLFFVGVALRGGVLCGGGVLRGGMVVCEACGWVFYFIWKVDRISEVLDRIAREVDRMKHVFARIMGKVDRLPALLDRIDSPGLLLAVVMLFTHV